MTGFRARNRSDSVLSRPDNIIYEDDDGQDSSSRPIPTGENRPSNAVLSTLAKLESAPHYGGSVRTPSRSFYHRSFHGSFGAESSFIPCLSLSSS
jgi:hypothetical protein